MLEAIARQSVEALREVICAYFGNIDRNSGYFLLRIFLSSHPTLHGLSVVFPVASLHLAGLHQMCNTFFIGLFCQSMSPQFGL